MIAVLSPTTKAILRAVIWPMPVILTIVSCGGLLLLAARITKIERRSYIRAMLIVAIGMGLAGAAQFAYAALGFSKWVGYAINHIWFWLPIPAIFKASIPRSLLTYVIAFGMVAVAILILCGLLMAVGIPLPE